MEESRRMDEQAQSLIEIIHFTENVATKIYGVLDEAEIFRAVREEFAKSKRYNSTIFLLADDGLKLRIVEASVISPEKLKAAEKATGLRLKEYRIDLKKSSILSQVATEGKTIQTTVYDVVGELFPQWLAKLISKIMGFKREKDILTPLYRSGKIIGVISMSSPELAEYFIPSVRSLAQHISTALELADEYAERKKMEEELETKARLLDAATDSITLRDFDGNYLYVNEATSKSRD